MKFIPSGLDISSWLMIRRMNADRMLSSFSWNAEE